MKKGIVWVVVGLALMPVAVQAGGRGARWGGGRGWGNGSGTVNGQLVGGRWGNWGRFQDRHVRFLPSRQFFQWNGEAWVTYAGAQPQFILPVGGAVKAGGSMTP